MTWMTCGRISPPFRGRWKRRTTHVCTYMVQHQGKCSWEEMR